VGVCPAPVPQHGDPIRVLRVERHSVATPVQDVRIWDIQNRSKRAGAVKPWVVRWKVDRIERSRSFKTKAEADRLRSQLFVAARNGERFDVASGLPEEWLPRAPERRLHEWVREWLAEQWPEWAPRTRISSVEALARFIPAVRPPGAPPVPPELRRYLLRALAPGFAPDPTHPCERWMAQWSPPLGELNREMLARAERNLATGLQGQQLGAQAAGRFRKLARATLLRAVDLGILESDPWPPPPRGRNARKSARRSRAFDARRLPGPQTMAAVIAAMKTHQPGSHKYAVMTAVAYYAGLRPSEVVMLRARSLTLPESGWGQIDVTEADIGFDEPGEPKTGERVVPIPPVLVELLREWVREHGLVESRLLFRTVRGKRPRFSNWSRALKRAYLEVGHQPLRIYDCRHAAATTWLRAGVPLRVVAMRLGHSVETLVSTYVGVLEGDEAIANERIDAALHVAPKLVALPSPDADDELAG
jgi:integrase